MIARSSRPHALVLSALLLVTARAEVSGPYAPDADTSFLLPLDEAPGSVFLRNEGTVAGDAIATGPNDPGSASPPQSDRLAGARAFPGFGRAVDLSGRPSHFLGWDGDVSGTFEADTGAAPSADRIELSALGIGDGSPFTLEALVRPSIAEGQREIISTDSSSATRGFQFRLTPGGSTGQQLEFHLIANGARQFAPIPDSGPHAFVPDRWFHAAFVYDGSEGRFHWTRLASEADEAHSIGSPTALSMAGAGSVEGPLVFGNENRNTSGESLRGRLDEVRISSVARAPEDFLFTPSGAIRLTSDDAPDTSSFDSAGQWSSGAAPESGNAYAVSRLLRTPADADDAIFPGDILRLSAGGVLLHKGTAALQTYTFPELVLNGGLVRAGTAHSQTMILDGSITVSGDGSAILADQADVVVDADLSGPGDLELVAGTAGIAHQLTLNGRIASGGNLSLSTATDDSLIRFSPTSELVFRPGEFGVSNRVGGTGRAAFEGRVTIDLADAPTTPGSRWSLIDTAGLTSSSFGGDFEITDWSEDDDRWTDPGGVFTFSESSGDLLVIPPPGSDSDDDGLPDAWEVFHFGSIAFDGTDDPDGDGDDNATELANGSAPANPASDSLDTDDDGLADTWETEHFGDLRMNGGDDPDGDGFGNLQEQEAGTLPHDAASRPAGTAARLVPIDDGDPRTSEFGFAGASAINTVSFVRSSLQTFAGRQYLTWHGRHQHDPDAPYNNTIWIGRRDSGDTEWEIFKHPTYTANNINDGHDVISFGVDGDGFMHLSWGMHGDEFHYAKSTAPVTGSGPISLGPDTTMTGNENAVTYPQFLRLPDGDLLYLYREGSSGSGDTYLNRYELDTGAWTNVHGGGENQSPVLKGTGWSPDYNAYPNMPQLGGPDGGDLVLTWCWRYEPVGGDSPAGEDGYQTNNMLAFARSPDGGTTWERSDGTAYALPISRDGESGDPATAAEHLVAIPEGSSYINQAGMCLDADGRPVVASWWAPGAGESPPDHRRQYMVAFHNDRGTPETDDDSWDTRQISQRTNNPATTKYSEAGVRDLGRPVVVTDDEERIIVAYRDDAGTNGLTIVHSLPKARDPERLVWIEIDLTTGNLGNYEPVIDNELWDAERRLHFLHQASEGEGFTAPDNLASRVSVLEWNAAAYFDQPGQPSIAFAPDGDDVTITIPSEPSWSYRLWTTTDFTDWQPVETKAGTGDTLGFTHTGNGADGRRFWRIESAEGGF